MAESNFSEQSAQADNETVVDEFLEARDHINNYRSFEAKKLYSLEADLIRALIDPFDSDYRKRYIKRWIYGEGIKNISKKFK